ncbi:MAG: DUF4911 domain-containing protein [Coprothermobacterota bacterium]|nr:DUF4911 domain-containing protein [Coprothermobacterota bacterium]
MRVPQEIRILIKVPREKESFVQSILESYEGLAMILNTEKAGGEIEMLISSNDSQKAELFEVLRDLSREIPLIFQEEEIL